MKKANQIVEYYERQEKKKGGHFNLFSILDRETNEVKTHSALIAELLNPDGSHGRGNLFLKSFLEQLSKKKEVSVFWKNVEIPTLGQLEKMKVYTERNVGVYRNLDSRLDILLTNNNWQIVIENKFNAKQGENQLERYSDYLKEDNSRKKILIYLTKTGESYKSNELTDGKDYFCLSYKDDILNWITSCKAHSEKSPNLKKSLMQYINLIKRETNQTINDEMKDEIRELILNQGIKGTSEIIKNYESALNFIADDFRRKLIAKLRLLKGVENIRKNNDPFYSIFFTVNRKTIGIESFNIDKKTLRNNSLFIGELDFKRKNKRDLVYKFWFKKTIENIWSEDEKLNFLNKYGKHKESRDAIVQEVMDYTEDYINRITKTDTY